MQACIALENIPTGRAWSIVFTDGRESSISVVCLELLVAALVDSLSIPSLHH